jgi:hypothetical protein
VNDGIFKAIIVGMFTIIIAMVGYTVTYMNKSTDADIASVNSRVDEGDHRIDRTLDRVNDIDRRLAAAEARILDLQMRR